MKKNYNQPLVEVAHLINGVQALCSSPTPGNVNLVGGGGSAVEPE